MLGLRDAGLLYGQSSHVKGQPFPSMFRCCRGVQDVLGCCWLAATACKLLWKFQWRAAKLTVFKLEEDKRRFGFGFGFGSGLGCVGLGSTAFADVGLVGSSTIEGKRRRRYLKIASQLPQAVQVGASRCPIMVDIAWLNM